MTATKAGTRRHQVLSRHLPTPLHSTATLTVHTSCTAEPVGEATLIRLIKATCQPTLMQGMLAFSTVQYNTVQ
jgi:hypothetical protein